VAATILWAIGFFRACSEKKLEYFVHEQFGVEAKAEVIERFHLLKGMSHRGGESVGKVEGVWRSLGRFWTWYFEERP